MKTLLLKLNLVLMIVFCSTATNANDLKGMINPPENDLVENATNIALGPLPFLESDVNFPEATQDGGGQQGGCTMNDESVWYKFTATKTGIVGASIAPANGPVIIFYSAPNENVTDPSELTYVDEPSNPCAVNTPSSIEAVEGTTYYIYMANGQAANIIINVSEAFAVPINDYIINAIDLGLESVPFVDEDVHILMSTNTDDSGQDGCNSESAPVIWYKFTAEADGQIESSIIENDELNVIVFYTADDLNATSGADLTWVDQRDNICGPASNNNTIIDAVEGTSYYILVASNSPVITFEIDLSLVLETPENLFDDFNYYPNPINNEINISANIYIEGITIFNLLGQQVYSELINTKSSSINLSHLNKGMYIMTVSSEGASASYKIIKK